MECLIGLESGLLGRDAGGMGWDEVDAWRGEGME